MMKELKVGDSFDVVEAISTDYCRGEVIYKKGDFGVCIKEYSFYIIAIIGPQEDSNVKWLMGENDYKKVGKLTITKLKKNEV